MKKLLLFVHGLGGDEESWGNFPALIQQDSALNGFDVALYAYPTSLIRAQNIVSLFSKVLAVFTPQTKLPKIQDLAQALKTEIEHRYADYEEIYLIVHSMGGLVAKKYLIDEIKVYKKENLRVKKLLLYAVPNNGSDLALISRVYPHDQIAQLAKNSDFIEFLNTDVATIKLENYVDMLYVIGTQDQVVDKQSAQAMWGNQNLETVHKGHINIIKPSDANDLSYIVCKNFILKEVTVKKSVREEKGQSTHSENNHNMNINSHNTINNTTNHVIPNNPEEGLLTKVGIIATVIGTTIGVITYFNQTQSHFENNDTNLTPQIFKEFDKKNATIENLENTLNNYRLDDKKEMYTIDKMLKEKGIHKTLKHLENKDFTYIKEEAKKASQLLSIKAKLYEITNQFEKANDAFIDSIKINRSISSLLHYANYLQEINQYKKALKKYQTIIEDFDLNDQQKITIYNNIGDIFLKEKNYKKAAYHYKKSFGYVKEKNLQIAEILDSLGAALTYDNNYTNAILYLNKALSIKQSLQYLNPSDLNISLATTYNNFGFAFEKAKDFNQSKNYYEKSLSIFKFHKIDSSSKVVQKNLTDLAKLSGF